MTEEKSRGKAWISFLCLISVLASWQPVRAEIRAQCEIQEGENAGVAAVRGWAFDTLAGVTIERVTLLINGNPSGDLLCCSGRVDVQAEFPQFPADNTLHSGWGGIVNWGALEEGDQTIAIEIENSNGEIIVTSPKTITVVKPGGFEFLSDLSLANAQADIQGNELLLSGAVVTDAGNSAQKEVDLRFGWSATAQQLRLVGAQDTDNAIASESSLWPRSLSPYEWFSLGSTGWARLLQRIAAVIQDDTAYAAPGLWAMFESPSDSQIGAGVTIARGWGFDPNGSPLKEIRLTIDDGPVNIIPCCLERMDVFDKYPDYPAALLSGWGTTLNYGSLDPDVHIVRVEIESLDGTVCVFEHTITTLKPGDFETIDAMLFTQTQVELDSNTSEIILDNVVVQSGDAEQLVNLRFRWDLAAQSLVLVFAETLTPQGPGGLDSPGGGTGQPGDPTPPLNPQPTLSVDTSGVRFRQGLLGGTKTEQFSLMNTGIGVLQVSLAVSGDAAFSLNSNVAFNLLAGQTRFINIDFSPTEEGVVSGSVDVTTNGGDAQVDLTGEGVIPVLNVSSSTVDFGQVETGGSATASIQLSNPGVDPIGGIAVSSVSAPFLLAVPDLSGGIAGGDSIDILIGFEPTAIGNFHTQSTITWQGGQSTTVLIDGEGTAPPLPLTISDNPFDFGGVTVGSAGLGTVTITNPNGHAVQGVSVSGPGDPFIVGTPDLADIPAGGSTDFSVGFEPLATGAASGTVVIHWGAGESTTMQLTGEGLPAP